MRLIFRILTTILVFDLVYLILTFFEEFVLDLRSYEFFSLTYSTIFHLSLLLIQLLVVSKTTLNWYTTSYDIGENTITKSKGFLIKTEKIFNYINVKNIVYRQGLIGRFFDYGDLSFETVGDTGAFKIIGIESPKKMANVLEKTQNMGSSES